jgi:hypothetical protein
MDIKKHTQNKDQRKEGIEDIEDNKFNAVDELININIGDQTLTVTPAFAFGLNIILDFDEESRPCTITWNAREYHINMLYSPRVNKQVILHNYWSPEEMHEIVAGIKYARGIEAPDHPTTVTIHTYPELLPTDVLEDTYQRLYELKRIDKDYGDAMKRYMQEQNQIERGLRKTLTAKPASAAPKALRDEIASLEALIKFQYKFKLCPFGPENNNIDEINTYMQAIPASDQNIIKLYTWGYDSLNRKINSGGELNYIERGVFSVLCCTVARAPPLREDIVLYRGINSNDYIDGVSRSFVSTTSNPIAAQRFTGNTCCLLKITVKAGTKILSLHSQDLTHFTFEKEILLPPGGIFRIVEKTHCDQSIYYHVEYSHSGEYPYKPLTDKDYAYMSIIARITPEDEHLLSSINRAITPDERAKYPDIIVHIYKILMTMDVETGYYLVEGLYKNE